MNKKICRLCLETVTENFQPIGECLNILKLNLALTKEAVTCIKCINSIQVFVHLKSTCINMRERTLPVNDLNNAVILDPVQIENTFDLKLATKPKDEIRCSFCTSTSRRALTSLYESKKNMYLVNILEKHIPELNLNNTEELLTCENCLDQLHSASRFLIKHIEVEDKIVKYIEIVGTDDKGDLELQDIQQFAFKPTLKLESCHSDDFEQSYDRTQGYTTKAEAEVKYENVDNLQLSIKTEDVHIKSDESDYESLKEPTEIKLDYDPKKIRVHEQEINSCWTKYKGSLKYNSKICKFMAKVKPSLNRYKLAHKYETTSFKCESCPYETNLKQSLDRHKLIHIGPSEISMFKCELCSFETKLKSSLNRHILCLHANLSGAASYKCESCTYETKHKQYLHKHKLTHNSSSGVSTFKCELCNFEAKCKSYLHRHVLRIHKHLSKMYKCECCTYETKQKQYLKSHKLIHKSSSDVKCELCKYETKHKNALTRHIMLIHINPSEVTLYKCESCSYETKLKYRLNQHTLSHKSPSEIMMFNCDMCKFSTKRNANLKKHKKIHQK